MHNREAKFWKKSEWKGTKINQSLCFATCLQGYSDYNYRGCN